MPQTLSNLLNLSLDPATEQHDLVAAAELDPVILAEFLKLEPPVEMAHWHHPFSRTHFMCVAAELANKHLSITEEEWKSCNDLGQYALICSHIAASLSKTAGSEGTTDARLTALLSSLGDNSLNYLPLTPRDAIRFQYAPADALKNTDSLIQIVAIANQLAQNSDIPIREDYLSDWGFHDSDARAISEDARKSVDQLLNNLSPTHDYKTEQAILAEALRNFQIKTILDLQLNATDNLQQEIQRLGASHFNLNGCQYFKQTTEGFACRDILITSTKSIVSQAAETRSIISSTEISMIVIDQQMIERSDSSKLIAIPVLEDRGGDGDGDVTGILVAGLDSYDPAMDSRGLRIFAASIAQATSISPQTDQVSVDSVRRKAREITHEVNNPFSIVQNYLKILKLKLGEEHEAQKAIDTISSEIQRAALILKRYNNLGEEESQSTAPANSEEVILGLVEVFRTSYPSITIAVKLQSDHPQITLSEDKLKQVLVNLFKNAIEAMGSSGEIMVRTTDINFPSTSYLELEVSDNGPGIAAEMRDNLFLPGTTSKTNEESGLGLGIVNDIVSINSGMISFQSDGTGTCFRILLPQTNTSTDSQAQSDRQIKETL